MNISNTAMIKEESIGLSTFSVAWKAIIAGAIVSLGYEILLNFLGIGLGMTTLNLSSDGMAALGIGAIMWLAISGIISMGIGGWFVGKLSNIKCTVNRACNGVIAWGLVSVILIVAASGGSGAMLGGVINMSGKINVSQSQNNQVNLNQGDQQQSSMANIDQNQVKEKAEEFAKKVGQSSLIMFIAFLLSGIASVIGAMLGANNRQNIKFKETVINNKN